MEYGSVSLSPTEVWQERFVAAKAKYETEMKAFLEKGGEVMKKQKRGAKEGFGSLKSLRSQVYYKCFSFIMIHSIDVSESLGPTWRKLCEEKKTKDPDAPKRPAGGAFGCFLAKNRAAFTKECEGQPVTAVTKLASAKWKALGDDEKKIFEEEYKAKMEAYQEAMKAYVPVPKDDDEPPAKKARISKEEKEALKKEKAAEKEAKKAKKADGKPRGRPAKAKTTAAPKVELQAAVAAKAEKSGLTEKLMKLVERDDVKASGKSQSAILKALEENDGLIHVAKRALLGA